MSEKTNRPPLKWLLISSLGIVLVGLVPLVWYETLPDDWHAGRELRSRGFMVTHNTFLWRQPTHVFGENRDITPEDGLLISRLPHLRSLRFTNCDMLDLNLDEIGKCRQLDSVHFIGAKRLSVDELRKLAPCPVTNIALYDSDLKDSDLEVLTELTTIKNLTLSNNAGITDAGLEHLEKIPSLRVLRLYGTGVTQDGVEEFKKKRPGVSVSL